MPDLLLAIAKSLAGVPGLAPVFNPLISLRDDEKAAKANDALLEKISEGHEVSQEALVEILGGILGVREDNLAIQQQMVAGFHAVVSLIQRQQDRFDIPARHQQSSTRTTTLEEDVSALIDENKDLLTAKGLVTCESLRDELQRRFGDNVGMLMAIAQPAGFPRGLVAINIAPIETYFKFLEGFDNLERPEQARITGAIARNIPGSDLLRAWAEVYAHDAIGV